MAKSYIKFEVSGEVVSKTYEALQMAKQSGSVRKGANEVTKSVERGMASFVVIATDVEPEEVVMHIPSLCEQKRIAFTYVPSKIELGKSIGLSVPCAAIAVENQGNAAQAIRDLTGRITGTSASPHKAEKPEKTEKPEKPEAAPKHEKKAEGANKEKEEKK
jgi:large subunit ribosomal protein L7Ae